MFRNLAPCRLGAGSGEPARLRADRVDPLVADCGEAVLTALAEGRITPEEAATVMGALSGHARVIETSEIVKRLRALEEAAAKKGSRQ